MKIIEYCLVFSILFLILIAPSYAHAESSVDGKISAEISYPETRGVQVSFRSEKESTSDILFSHAEINGKLSSKGNRILKFTGELEGELSESGMELLSKKKILGNSLIDLLSLADGSPELIETAIADRWKGKRIGEVQLMGKAISVLLPLQSNNLSKLKIEAIDLSRLSWDSGNLKVGFSLEVRVQREQALPSEEVLVKGSIESENNRTVKKASFNFSPAPGDWKFRVPYLDVIFGGYKRSELKEKLTMGEVKAIMKLTDQISIENVPRGHLKEGSTYVWNGENGARVLASLITGEGGCSVDLPKGGDGGGSGPGSENPFLLLGTIACLIAASGGLIWHFTKKRN